MQIFRFYSKCYFEYLTSDLDLSRPVWWNLDRCTAPVKLPARHGLRSVSPPGAARAPGGFTPEPFLWVTKIPAPHRTSKGTIKVVVFQLPPGAPAARPGSHRTESQQGLFKTSCKQ